MNLPPFVPLRRNQDGQPIFRDRCTREGAEDTARAIKHVWRCHGYQNVTAEIYVAVSQSGDTTKMVGKTIWGVKTNLVGGLPPRQR